MAGGWLRGWLAVVVFCSWSAVVVAIRDTVTLEQCGGPFEGTQSWEFVPPVLRLVRPPQQHQAPPAAQLCLTAEAFSRGAGVGLSACNASDRLQHFARASSGPPLVIHSGSPAFVLDIQGYSNTTGSRVQLWTETTRGNQLWKSMPDNLLQGVWSALCLTPILPTCEYAVNIHRPFCNTSWSPRARATDLVSRITNLTQKALQLAASAGNRYDGQMGFPEYHVTAPTFTEALHGAVCGCVAAEGRGMVCPTSFPHALAASASLNRTAWALMGSAIGTEVRGLHNHGMRCGLFVWAPDINLIRDARWGRAMEVPGEDVAINSEYASAVVYSMQYSSAVPAPYQRVLSQPKHAIVYNLEGRRIPNPPYKPRPEFNAVVSKKDLVEYYLMPWRAAIVKGQARGCMCSVNDVNAVPSCANKPILHDVFRDDWGLSGAIVSDGGACYDPNYQEYINRTLGRLSPDLAAKVCVETIDTEIGTLLSDNIDSATKTTGLNVTTVDRAVTDIYEQVIRAGAFDRVPVLDNLGLEDVDTAANRQLAQEVAEQSFVLLKNNNNLLPLSSNTTVALIGPHANATTIMLSNYVGPNVLVNSNSPLQALQRFGSGHNLAGMLAACDLRADGCASLTAPLDHVTQLAAKADIAVVVIGLYPCGGGDHVHGGSARESEADDRGSIALPGQQAAIVAAALKGNPRVVVVVMNGGQVAMPPSVLTAPTLLEAFYPGELGGPALVNVLFGVSAVSGRLPYTLYDVEYDTLRQMNDSSLTGGSGTTYMYYKGPVQYPMGRGMSYTTWKATPSAGSAHSGSACALQATTDALAAEFRAYYQPGLSYKSRFSFNVTVNNMGVHASPLIVMAFAGQRSSPDHSPQPQRQLVGFERHPSVAPGNTATVAVGLLPATLTVVTADGVQHMAPGTVPVTLDFGDPQTSPPVQCTLTITGASVVVWQLPEGM
eukprot:m.6131 g.6131  ORF g.6131 m.6131 type:complete len:944 (+) comp2552_c0_seq1:64-2895(+)